MENITKTITRFRKEKKLTQKEMADRLNMARSTYSKLELGNTELHYKTLIRISKTLDVPMNSIINENITVFAPISEKLATMLFLAHHHLGELMYKIIPYHKLTSEHMDILRKKKFDQRERYEYTPLGGRIYKYGPKALFAYMMSVLSMDVLFTEKLILDKYWLSKWNDYNNKKSKEIEIDEFEYLEVNIFQLIMPNKEEKWIQIATKDFPKNIGHNEKKAIAYLKTKTGAVAGSSIATTMDGYDPYTEIVK